MRVGLVMNPAAGSGNHDRDDMVAGLEAHADRVDAVDPHRWNLRRALRRSFDLLVVAGGDGTVGRVARALSGTRIPLHIIPTGTANNIARSLAISRRELNVQRVMNEWSLQRVNAIASGRDIIIESVGCGAIAQLIRNESDDDRSTLPAERKKLRALIEQLPAFGYEMKIDGKERTGTAILIETLVMPHIGPRVVLGSKRLYCDSTLAVVVVHADERHRLARHLGLEKGAGASLRTFRGKEVTIDCAAPWHVDDEPRRARSRTLTLLPAAWQVFVPKSAAA